MAYGCLVTLVVLLQWATGALGMRIVGGVQNPIVDAPWTASLQKNREHICGATILNEGAVLTAAHCVKGTPARKLSIRVGSDMHASGGETRTIASIKAHPKYADMSMAYDVALLFLSTPLNFTDTIQPIALPDSQDMLRADIPARICGWGTLTEDGSMSAKLRCASIKVIKMTKCKSIYGTQLKPTMFCAGLLSGAKDACQGDSGGGLIIDDKVAGIVSWGIGCAVRNFPGVYTSVNKVYGWITSNLN